MNILDNRLNISRIALTFVYDLTTPIIVADGSHMKPIRCLKAVGVERCVEHKSMFNRPGSTASIGFVGIDNRLAV